MSAPEKLTSLTQHELRAGESVEFGLGGLEAANFPKFGNYDTLAEVQLGAGTRWGRPFPLERLFVLHVPNQHDPTHTGLMVRAHRLGVQGTANFVLAAVVDLEDSTLTGLAPLTNLAEHGLGGNRVEMVGRRGSVYWLKSQLNDSELDDISWNPFAENRGIADQQFDVEPKVDSVLLKSLIDFTANEIDTKTFFKGVNVVHRDAAGRTQTTEEHDIIALEQARQRQSTAGKIANVFGRRR